MTPLASQPSSIEDDWTDERIILFLRSWKCEDTLPSNVITDVNPFGIEPWNAPENFWYLCNIQDASASRGKAIVDNPSYGYWKDTRYDHPIFIDSQYSGRKITWKFVGQNAPTNDNICWIMFEYILKTKECEAANKMNMNMKSLYKILGRNHHLAVLEDSDQLQSVRLSMGEREFERAEESEGSLSDKKSRARELDEVPADFLNGDFSNGDFLELKDLDAGAGSSSSSSDNSSRVSFSSDDYFDSEALLRDLENDNDPSVEGRRTNSTNPFSPSSSPDSNSQQPGTSRVSRIKKLGKKYFCFAS